MSDADKPTPESPQSGTSEASAGGRSAEVISIDQARAELLQRKPRSRATPPMGVKDRPRSRGREVPIPVTLPPGEHSAVIVTDTPAARAHVDKKTVHPGEAPPQTHDKKVRVKTHMDPRRQKTQVTERRSSTPVPGAVGESDVGSLWSNPPGSQPPEPITSSRPPPPGMSPSQRPSLARPRPLPRDQRNGPLFLVGIALAAAAGAIVVFFLSRQKLDPSGPGSGATSGTSGQLTAVFPVPSPGVAPSTSAPATTSTTSAATSVPVPPELPSAVPATPLKTGHSPSSKPSASPSAPPTASAKPTATSILPFGKEEP